jgi:hypothetical protein
MRLQHTPVWEEMINQIPLSESRQVGMLQELQKMFTGMVVTALSAGIPGTFARKPAQMAVYSAGCEIRRISSRLVSFNEGWRRAGCRKSGSSFFSQRVVSRRGIGLLSFPQFSRKGWNFLCRLVFQDNAGLFPGAERCTHVRAGTTAFPDVSTN